MRKKKFRTGLVGSFFFRRRRLFIFSRRYFITLQFPNGAAAGAGFSSRVFFLSFFHSIAASQIITHVFISTVHGRS